MLKTDWKLFLINSVLENKMFHVELFMNYDVVVIGGGHAGVEAAVMARRLNLKVAIVTFCSEDIGVMSCNPAMGGLGKGHLIREIDAMGGVMGLASDLSGIQFRMLNRARGEAVQGLGLKSTEICTKVTFQISFQVKG